MATEPAWQLQVGRATRTAQIIMAAMVAGPSFFLVAVLILPAPQPPAGQPVLTWIALVVAVAMMCVRLVVPPWVTAHRRRAIASGQFQVNPRQVSPKFRGFLEITGDAGLLWLVYVTKLLMAGAPLEGGAFLALVAYMIEGDPWALGAAVVLLASLAMMIPRREAVIAWIEDQLRLLEQERQWVR